MKRAPRKAWKLLQDATSLAQVGPLKSLMKTRKVDWRCFLAAS